MTTDDPGRWPKPAGGSSSTSRRSWVRQPTGRARLLETFGRNDPLIADALQTVIERGDLISTVADEGPARALAGDAPAPIETDPAIVTELIERSEASVAALQHDIRAKSRSALLDFIEAKMTK